MRVLLLTLTLLLFSVSVLAQPPAHAPAHGARGGPGSMQGQGRSDVNTYEIRQIFGRHEGIRGDALPPGIRKNLARGKALPPGIAKRVEGPLASDLPHYPDHEWNLVGNDAVLIDSATRLIVDIVDNVLR